MLLEVTKLLAEAVRALVLSKECLESGNKEQSWMFLPHVEDSRRLDPDPHPH